MSLEEEEEQERSKLEQPKQLHLTLDANLTVQTRRRYVSSMPSSIEELRKKNWLLPRCVNPTGPCSLTLKAQARWWVRTGTTVSSMSSS